jgi:flagellar M-ring protein FliF
MKEQVLARAQRFWKGFLAFTPGQKAVTIAAILAITVGGYLFSSWASRPSYGPLFTNLAPTDASAIIDKLNANKTPYQLAANGTEILVPTSQVYPLRLTMSSAGLPSSGNTGYSLLDKQGFTTSQFVQQVDYQRAVEGELGNTIKSITGITAAAVHLAIPQQSVFSDGSQKPTASVLITTQPGSTITTNQVQSIVNLVSSSVPGLAADQVSVSDSTGKVLSAAGTGLTTGSTDTQNTATQAYEQSLTTKAQAMLDQVLGAGNAIVTLNANLSFDKNSILATSYAAASGVSPLVVNNTSEAYGGNAGASGGPLGANSVSPSASSSANTSGSASASSSASGNYVRTSTNQQNTVNSIITNTVTAPGDLKNLTVSVVLNKAAAAGVNLTDVQNQVSNAVGFSAKRGDTISVSSQTFNTTAATAAAAAAAKAAKDAAAAKSSAALISMIKTGGLVVLVLAIVIITVIANKRRKRPEEPDDLDIFLSTLRDDPDSLPPAPEDIIPGPTKEARLGVARQAKLAEMAENDPQEVARLLRSWLNAKDA